LNPRSSSFRNWGGRGIRVCDAWRDSFEAFLRDVGPRPSKAHSIDRYPNNDGHYEPGNVRWATPREQQSNKRSAHPLTFQGETLSVMDWARRLGMPQPTLANRIRRGWSTERALTTPSNLYHHHGVKLSTTNLNR